MDGTTVPKQYTDKEANRLLMHEINYVNKRSIHISIYILSGYVSNMVLMMPSKASNHKK